VAGRREQEDHEVVCPASPDRHQIPVSKELSALPGQGLTQFLEEGLGDLATISLLEEMELDHIEVQETDLVSSLQVELDLFKHRGEDRKTRQVVPQDATLGALLKSLPIHRPHESISSSRAWWVMLVWIGVTEMQSSWMARKSVPSSGLPVGTAPVTQ